MKTVNASQLPDAISDGIAYYSPDEDSRLEYTIATKQWSGVLMEYNDTIGDWQDIRELTSKEALDIAIEYKLLKPKN
jgi:hypothetical protein